jgi:hypothetical protein
MNRREALAALVALPATSRISVAQLKPDDVIILECDDPLSDAVALRLRIELERVWPGHKVIVLAERMRIQIAEGSKTGGG